MNIRNPDSRFRRVFANKHVVIPVVRVECAEQARRSTQIAENAGADGVFLTNHSISYDALLRTHSERGI